MTLTAALPPMPPTASPLPGVRVAAAATADAARSLVRLAQGRRRTPTRVATEYDDGSWAAVRDEGAWRSAASLEEFLVGTSTEPMRARIHNQVVELPRRDYYRWRLATVQRLVAEAAEPDRSLLELGCGFGMNLFSLSLDPRWTRLRGLDISPTGVAVARDVAAHFAAPVTFGEIDLTDPRHAGFGEVAGQTVLTYYCLEQLPRAVGPVVDAIRAARPRRVIHVESASGLLTRRPLDVVNELYVRSMDYQRSLVSTIDALAARGEIRVLHRERLTFGSSIHNDPSLLVWEPSP